MTDDRKILPFPSPPPDDPDVVLSIDLDALAEDILDAAKDDAKVTTTHSSLSTKAARGRRARGAGMKPRGMPDQR
jgi:hypothetical protein